MGARTGQEYIEGLRDGRSIYVNGELVRDVTQHPPFQGVIHTRPGCMIASTTQSIKTS